VCLFVQVGGGRTLERRVACKHGEYLHAQILVLGAPQGGPPCGNLKPSEPVPTRGNHARFAPGNLPSRKLAAGGSGV
jgi:hypothetical protein